MENTEEMHEEIGKGIRYLGLHGLSSDGKMEIQKRRVTNRHHKISRVVLDAIDHRRYSLHLHHVGRVRME